MDRTLDFSLSPSVRMITSERPARSLFDFQIFSDFSRFSDFREFPDFSISDFPISKIYRFFQISQIFKNFSIFTIFLRFPKISQISWTLKNFSIFLPHISTLREYLKYPQNTRFSSMLFTAPLQMRNLNLLLKWSFLVRLLYYRNKSQPASGKFPLAHSTMTH